MSWSRYSQWVVSQLVGFAGRPLGERAVAFTRSLPGDVHSLVVEEASPGPPARIRLSFQAYPN